MSGYDSMTADEREAERIIRRWIQDKTGVSDFERSMWHAGVAIQATWDAIREAIAPMRDFMEAVEVGEET